MFVARKYLFESDEEDNFVSGKTNNLDNKIQKLIKSDASNYSWFTTVKQLLSLTTRQGWTIYFDETNPLEIEITFTLLGVKRANFKLQVSSTSPYFPSSPPMLLWLGPRYSWRHTVGLLFFDPLLQTKWNLCTDMVTDILERIYTFVTELDEQPVCEHFIQTSEESVVIRFISNTMLYPSVFDSSLPSWGIVKSKEKMDKTTGGVGYSVGKVDTSFHTNYEMKRAEYKEMFYSFSNLVVSLNSEYLIAIPLCDYIIQIAEYTSLQEMETNIELYLAYYMVSDKLLRETQLPNEKIEKLIMLWIALWDEIQNVLWYSGYKPTQTELNMSDIVDRWKTYSFAISTLLPPDFSTLSAIEKDENEIYKQRMSERQLLIWEDEFRHHTYKHLLTDHKNIHNPQWIKRLMREWKDMVRCRTLLLEGTNSNIYVRWSGETCTPLWKVLFCPAKGTPYFGGCFLFDLYIPEEYPSSPPKMILLTTGGGTVRFNPNLYSCGKVCLSLLGTWSGEAWTPQLSNLNQLLLSVSTMIFVDDPYFNEPGYQNLKNTEKGTYSSNKYNSDLYENTIKYAVHDMIKNPPEEFADVIHEHFRLLWNSLEEEYVNVWYKKNVPNSISGLLCQCREMLGI